MRLQSVLNLLIYTIAAIKYVFKSNFNHNELQQFVNIRLSTFVQNVSVGCQISIRLILGVKISYTFVSNRKYLNNIKMCCNEVRTPMRTEHCTGTVCDGYTTTSNTHNDTWAERNECMWQQLTCHCNSSFGSIAGFAFIGENLRQKLFSTLIWFAKRPTTNLIIVRKAYFHIIAMSIIPYNVHQSLVRCT